MRNRAKAILESFILCFARLLARIPPIRWVLVKCYVAANNEEGALKVALALHRNGYGVISNILGESAEEKTATNSAERYKLHIKNLTGLRKQIPDIKLAISVKPSQIGLFRNEELAFKLGLEILNECTTHNVGFEMDMEGPETMDATVELVRKLADNTEKQKHPKIRIAIPANQEESKEAVLRLANHNEEVSIRIVKGAYPGYFTKKYLIDRQFVKLATLASEQKINVALGTHDVNLIGRIKKSLPEAVVQMLFGVRPFANKDFVYMCWGSKKDAEHYLERRMKEGARINVVIIFALNILFSAVWRIKMKIFSRP